MWVIGVTDRLLTYWRITNSVKDTTSGTGRKTRLFRCQDSAHRKKTKPSINAKVASWDTVGMHRYDCESHLTVICWDAIGEENTDHVITIILCHHDNHVPYYDVDMLEGASDIIRESLEWTTPIALVPRIQALYPNVSANQVHTIWTKMSETLEKRRATASVCREATGRVSRWCWCVWGS
jgi:hypothetical protein